MPDAAPSKRPSRNQQMLCPRCNGDSFTEHSSFKTSSEPLLGAASANVIIDLMSCKRCGTDIPAVRGKKQFALVSKEKLASLVAELQEAQQVNSEIQSKLQVMEKRSASLDADIVRCRAEGEVTVLEEKVAGLETANNSLEATRARLAETLRVLDSRIPAASR